MAQATTGQAQADAARWANARMGAGVLRLAAMERELSER